MLLTHPGSERMLGGAHTPVRTQSQRHSLDGIAAARRASRTSQGGGAALRTPGGRTPVADSQRRSLEAAPSPRGGAGRLVRSGGPTPVVQSQFSSLSILQTQTSQVLPAPSSPAHDRPTDIAAATAKLNRCWLDVVCVLLCSARIVACATSPPMQISMHPCRMQYGPHSCMRGLRLSVCMLPIQSYAKAPCMPTGSHKWRTVVEHMWGAQ